VKFITCCSHHILEKEFIANFLKFCLYETKTCNLLSCILSLKFCVLCRGIKFALLALLVMLWFKQTAVTDIQFREISSPQRPDRLGSPPNFEFKKIISHKLLRPRTEDSPSQTKVVKYEKIYATSSHICLNGFHREQFNYILWYKKIIVFYWKDSMKNYGL
jgi:hypothetical protein